MPTLSRLAASVTDLTAPTPPAQGHPEPVGTTSVSLTYTHPGAPEGTAWTLHVIDQATGSAITPSSGDDLGAYAIPVSDGTRAVHWMDAEGPDGQTSRSTPGVIVVEQDVADAYPVEGSAGWREVWSCDLTAATTQSIPNGASTITLSGDTITTRGATAGGAAFGTNNTCSVINGQGLVLECTTTSSMLPEVTLTLPLGETLTADHALRVSVKWRVYNEDSNDSGWLYVADSAVTPTLDVSSASDVAGARITGQTASLTYRRGAQPSPAGVTVPVGLSNGTIIYTEVIVPGYGNDAVIRLDDRGFKQATPQFRGRSQSAAAAPTTTATAWAEGLSSIKLMLGVGNGGSGAGTPKGVVESILIEVR
jgi:hypothetical protein